jgi:hypothetical protein
VQARSLNHTHQVEQLLAALRVSEQTRLRRVEEIEALLGEATRAFQDNRHQADAIKVQLDLVDGAVSTLDRRYRMLTARGVRAEV